MASQLTKARTLSLLRTVHGWLGILVVPWIIIIGATGFYLNHSRMVLSLFETPPYDERQFEDWPGARPVTENDAARVAAGVWPSEAVVSEKNSSYHKRAAQIFKKPSGQIIVVLKTGHYFTKTRFVRKTFAPDGTQLHKRIYWGNIFKQMHTDGWLGGKLGSWFADITSLTMIVFGITGIVIWWMPRARRFKRAIFGATPH